MQGQVVVPPEGTTCADCGRKLDKGEQAHDDGDGGYCCQGCLETRLIELLLMTQGVS